VPWERHSSSRRWARQRSAPWLREGRLPGRLRLAARGRPPPPPHTRTADGSPVSHPRAAAAASARAPRPAARRFIARRPGGPDPPDGARSGRTGAPDGLAPSPGRRTSTPLGPPLTGRPECCWRPEVQYSRAGAARGGPSLGRSSTPSGPHVAARPECSAGVRHPRGRTSQRGPSARPEFDTSGRALGGTARVPGAGLQHFRAAPRGDGRRAVEAELDTLGPPLAGAARVLHCRAGRRWRAGVGRPGPSPGPRDRSRARAPRAVAAGAGTLHVPLTGSEVVRAPA
jgi:hypothetical protein